MKTNVILIIIASCVLLVFSCMTTSCNKPKLVGTSWRMYEHVQALDDGPSLTFDITLKFIDKTNVEILDVNESSGYSASYMNPDGTVDYHPGSKTEESKKGTYTVNGNKLTITVEGKAETYTIRKNYLIYDIDEKEYDALQEYQRAFYTYKKL